MTPPIHPLDPLGWEVREGGPGYQPSIRSGDGNFSLYNWRFDGPGDLLEKLIPAHNAAIAKVRAEMQAAIDSVVMNAEAKVDQVVRQGSASMEVLQAKIVNLEEGLRTSDGELATRVQRCLDLERQIGISADALLSSSEDHVKLVAEVNRLEVAFQARNVVEARHFEVIRGLQREIEEHKITLARAEDAWREEVGKLRGQLDAATIRHEAFLSEKSDDVNDQASSLCREKKIANERIWAYQLENGSHQIVTGEGKRLAWDDGRFSPKQSYLNLIRFHNETLSEMWQEGEEARTQLALERGKTDRLEARVKAPEGVAYTGLARANPPEAVGAPFVSIVWELRRKAVGVRHRADAASPGGWSWVWNKATKTIRLQAGDLFVMDFERWGMQAAAPRFRNFDLCAMFGFSQDQIRPQVACARPGGDNLGIDHPDAIFIASAHHDVETLLTSLEEAVTLAELEHALSEARRADGQAASHRAFEIEAKVMGMEAALVPPCTVQEDPFQGELTTAPEMLDAWRKAYHEGAQFVREHVTPLRATALHHQEVAYASRCKDFRLDGFTEALRGFSERIPCSEMAVNDPAARGYREAYHQGFAETRAALTPLHATIDQLKRKLETKPADMLEPFSVDGVGFVSDRKRVQGYLDAFAMELRLNMGALQRIRDEVRCSCSDNDGPRLCAPCLAAATLPSKGGKA